METARGVPSRRLQGRVAVVTGSTGSMGEGIARRLALEGAAVVVSGRRTEHGEQVVRSICDAGVPVHHVDIVGLDDVYRTREHT